MQVVGQRDIDRINVWIGQQRIIAVVDLQPRGKPLKRRRLGGIRCGQGKQLGPTRHVDRRAHVFLGKIRRPKNTPPNWIAHSYHLRQIPRAL